MTTAVSRQINIPLIADFPDVLDELILSYVDRRSCVGAMANHSEFSSRKAVVVMNKSFEKEDAEALGLGYEPLMIATFKAHDLFLIRLPMFQLPQGKNVRRLKVEDAPSCLMRWRRATEPGSFVFKIRKKDTCAAIFDDPAHTTGVYHFEPRKASGLNNTQEIHWLEHGIWTENKLRMYRTYHKNEHADHGALEECADCSIYYPMPRATGAKTRYFAQLLEGTDPYFELDGPVQQVDNPLRLAAPQEETAPEKE